jgi:ligand-binding sensor domain-containing protein
MKFKCITFAIIIGVMFFSANPEPTGRWYKPFNCEAFSYIWGIAGTENRLWFTTENGVGYMDVATRKTTFFSYRSMGIPCARGYRIISCDSTRISLYSNDNGLINILQYNGTSWMTTVCPQNMNTFSSKIDFQITADNSGVVWVNDGVKMLRYNGSSWVAIDDSVFDYIRKVYTINGNGGLFVGTGDPDINDTIMLAQFDGTRFKPMTTLNESPRYTGFVKKDRNGSFWIHGKTRLYMISADNQLTTHTLDTAHIRLPCCAPLLIDNSGNLWTTWADSHNQGINPTLIRYELSTGKVHKTEYNEYIDNITLCGDGLYVTNQKDGTVLYFDNNDSKVTTLTLTKPDSKANFFDFDNLLFCKNGSIVRSFENSVAIYDSSSCKALPPLCSVMDVIENRDGKLYARDNSDTLYVLDGNKWTPDQILEPGTIGNLVFDCKNQLWGTVANDDNDNLTVIHQTEKGWELFDSSNSNLNIVTSSRPDLFAGSDGSIWIDAYYAVTHTFNGYHWTQFDESNGFSPDNVASRYLDKSGIVTFLIKSDCTPPNLGLDSCYSIIRKKFTGATVLTDTLKTPIPLYLSELFEDRGGDIWIIDYNHDWSNYTQSSVLYRHTSSGWITYDSSNTSFFIDSYWGADAHGRLYFNDRYNETVVFDPYAGNSRVVNKTHVSDISPVGCFVSGNVLSVDYTVVKPQTTEFALYTAMGKRVLFEKSNELRAGRVKKQLPLHVAKGLYILKITAPGYTQTAQVLVH